MQVCASLPPLAHALRSTPAHSLISRNAEGLSGQRRWHHGSLSKATAPPWHQVSFWLHQRRAARLRIDHSDPSCFMSLQTFSAGMSRWKIWNIELLKDSARLKISLTGMWINGPDSYFFFFFDVNWWSVTVTGNISVLKNEIPQSYYQSYQLTLHREYRWFIRAAWRSKRKGPRCRSLWTKDSN